MTRRLARFRAPWLFALLPISMACSGSAARRLDVTPTLASRQVGLNVKLRADSVMPPRGDQMVAGWMGSVFGGFVAWRIFDEPSGQHSRVKDDWGYTPRALTALGIGSYVGGTLGVWMRGRANGSQGSLLHTALGVAAATVPVWASTDDPLLMLKLVIAWGPLQGTMGYAAYRAGSPSAARPGSSGTDNRPDPIRRRSERLIVREELTQSSVRNVHDAIRLLRPQWFTMARLRSPIDRESAGVPGVIIAYLEGTRYGSVDALQQLSLDGVDAIEFYTAVEATSRFGTGHPAGAVNVRMSRSSQQ